MQDKPRDKVGVKRGRSDFLPGVLRSGAIFLSLSILPLLLAGSDLESWPLGYPSLNAGTPAEGADRKPREAPGDARSRPSGRDNPGKREHDERFASRDGGREPQRPRSKEALREGFADRPGQRVFADQPSAGPRMQAPPAWEKAQDQDSQGLARQRPTVPGPLEGDAGPGERASQRATVSSRIIERLGMAVRVEWSNGWAECVRNGHYKLIDPRGRQVIDRPAEFADLSRLRALGK